MTTLAYSIENAPPEITAIAASLSIERIAVVPPRFYTRRIDDARTFSHTKAEGNLIEIAAICDGASIIITDIEKQHRSAIRNPDSSPEQFIAAARQYIACWEWFHDHWPTAKRFSWNLVNAREPGVFARGEDLVLSELDGFAVSCYVRDKGNWYSVREQIIAHAKSLVDRFPNKIVIAGVHERYKDPNADGTARTLVPVPRDMIRPMVRVALQADVVQLWSNSYAVDLADPVELVNAQVVEVMAEMRIQAEE